VPAYYPQRMLDAAEQRDFMSGLEPFMLDLQKQVTAGISNLGSIVTGLQQQTATGVESARQTLLGAVPPPPSAAGPPPELGQTQDLASPGYLASAVPESQPTPPPSLSAGLSAGSTAGPVTAPPPEGLSRVQPEAPASGFRLPSWQELTGLAPRTDPAAPAQPQAAARPSDPFTLPSFEQLTGFPATPAPQPTPAAPAAGLSGAPGASTGTLRGPPSAPGEIEAYIRSSAARRGIDPDVAVRVVQAEGGLTDPVRQSDVIYQGRRETSYGPLQLNTAGGVGSAALRAGIDPRDPAQWRQAVDFGLDEVARAGWGQWHGAARVGVGNQQGIGTYRGPVPEAPAARAAAPAPAATGGGGLDVSGITQAYTGVPYTFGGPGGRGQGLGATTDCSGFVSAVWKAQYGLDLPAHTDAAYTALKGGGAPEVRQADARPGDVVFYMGSGTGGAITHHMGVYAGSGQVLDMSTSGGSGVKVRPVGHGGQFVILRDPRLNPEAPRTASAPPPIVPTGVAERTGGQKVPQAQVDALSNRPTAGEAGGAVWLPPQPAEVAPYQDDVGRNAADIPALEGQQGLSTVALHPRAASAFEQANGRPPTAAEAAELASLGFG